MIYFLINLPNCTFHLINSSLTIRISISHCNINISLIRCTYMTMMAFLLKFPQIVHVFKLRFSSSSANALALPSNNTLIFVIFLILILASMKWVYHQLVGSIFKKWTKSLVQENCDTSCNVRCRTSKTHFKRWMFGMTFSECIHHIFGIIVHKNYFRHLDKHTTNNQKGLVKNAFYLASEIQVCNQGKEISIVEGNRCLTCLCT